MFTHRLVDFHLRPLASWPASMYSSAVEKRIALFVQAPYPRQFALIYRAIIARFKNSNGKLVPISLEPFSERGKRIITIGAFLGVGRSSHIDDIGAIFNGVHIILAHRQPLALWW